MASDEVKAGGPLKGNDPLLDKFDDLRGTFGAYHTQLEENRRYYRLDFGNDVVPPAEDQADDLWPVIPDTAQRAIDESANHILYVPSVKFPVRPSKTGRERVEQERAEAKRLFSRFWWETVTRKYNVLGDGRKLLLNEGKIVIRQTIRWDLLPDRPKKGNRNARRRFKEQMRKVGHHEFLWNVELLDNATVYEDPANHRDPSYVFLQ